MRQSTPNIQQIPVPGNPGRETIRRFRGYNLPEPEKDEFDELGPDPDEDEEDKYDGPFGVDEGLWDDLASLDSQCLPGVPL